LLPQTLPRALSVRIQLAQRFAQVFDFKDGAGEGNRTLVISLEGFCSICCGRCMLTSDLSSISPLGATAERRFFRFGRHPRATGSAGPVGSDWKC